MSTRQLHSHDVWALYTMVMSRPDSYTSVKSTPGCWVACVHQDSYRRLSLCGHSIGELHFRATVLCNCPFIIPVLCSFIPFMSKPRS